MCKLYNYYEILNLDKKNTLSKKIRPRKINYQSCHSFLYYDTIFLYRVVNWILHAEWENSEDKFKYAHKINNTYLMDRQEK